MATLQEWIDCQTADGNPLPPEKRATCDKYRARHPEMVRGELPHLPKLIHNTGTCAKRGESLRVINTPGCSCRNKTATIYECLEFGECTPWKIGRHHGQFAYCQTCEQFQED